jgi:hypothetical protein
MINKNYQTLILAANELKIAYDADLRDGPDWYSEEEERKFHVQYPHLMEVICGIIEFAEPDGEENV